MLTGPILLHLLLKPSTFLLGVWYSWIFISLYFYFTCFRPWPYWWALLLTLVTFTTMHRCINDYLPEISPYSLPLVIMQETRQLHDDLLFVTRWPRPSFSPNSKGSTSPCLCYFILYFPMYYDCMTLLHVYHKLIKAWKENKRPRGFDALLDLKTQHTRIHLYFENLWIEYVILGTRCQLLICSILTGI